MTPSLKWKLIAGFLLVFIAGGMTGAWIGASHGRHLFFRSRHSHELPDRMRERLVRQLHLTSDQVAKVSPIIEQTSSQLEAIRGETARRVGETMQESHLQMAPLLTSEQREKLAKIEQAHRKKLRHRKFLPPEANEVPP
jgi:Spy/CpxP family protein refolding chaperone